MRYLLGGLLVVMVIWTVATSITQVPPAYRAVVRRFGKILDEKPGPGLYIGLPWGMDRVDRVLLSDRTVTVGLVGKETEEEGGFLPSGQLLTGDHNLINFQAVIQFRVIEDQVDQFVLLEDRADSLIARAAEAALAEWVASQTVDDILLRGKALLPGWLLEQVQNRIATYQLGVQIEQVNIPLLSPPTEVQPAFDAVGQEQTRIRTQINQAEQEAFRKLRDAESEVFRSQRQTAAYAREQDLAAKAEAENFLKRLDQYHRLTRTNPTYLNVLWLDEMTRLYARMRETGRLDLLDHYLSGDGLNITQFPLAPKKK